MSEDYISNPRPLFDEVTLENRNDNERLFMGSGSSGIIFDVTCKGIEVNGYYEGFNKGDRYINLQKPLFIAWKEFDKIKQRAEAHNNPNKIFPDLIEEDLDEEYLATLPIVHINDKEYYIDGARRERRSVDRPQDVYKF